jgi:hypothetical protein
MNAANINRDISQEMVVFGRGFSNESPPTVLKRDVVHGGNFFREVGSSSRQQHEPIAKK